LRLFKALTGVFAKPSLSPGLEKRVETLEERWNTIEAEWTEWFEKFRLLHLRIAHRQKALEKMEADAASAKTDTPNGGAPAQVDLPLTGGLTDAQREMQQKILRTRARLS
jgi:hypothetical protein